MNIRRIWSLWLRFTEVLGNIQLAIVLSLIYWVVVPFVAIPFKILADPLSVRKSSQPRWNKREPITDALEHLRKQG